MHVRLRRRSVLAVLVLVLASVAAPAAAQSGFDDDRVLLQGFYWESYRHGHAGLPSRSGPGAGTRSSGITRRRSARRASIWSGCRRRRSPASLSAGYDPREYFNLANSYGSFAHHRAMLETLLRSGVEPVADLVLNHRNGNAGWANFKNPDWGLWAITRGDEAFFDPASGRRQHAGVSARRRGGASAPT